MPKNTLLGHVALGDLDGTYAVISMCMCERAHAPIHHPEHDGRRCRSGGAGRQERGRCGRLRVVRSREPRRRRAEQR